MSQRIASSRISRQQDGLVLVIVLVVMVAMTLGSLALFKSVDTGALVSANMSYKRDAINRAASVLNQAMTVMTNATWQSAAVNNSYCQTSCTNIYNYSPRLLESDTAGIPVVLKTASNFGASSLYQYDTASGDTTLAVAGMTGRFLIERMCYVFGAPSTTNCVIAGDVVTGGDVHHAGQQPISTSEPLYRITVRIDGPRNTVVYAQAVVGVSSNAL